MFNNTEQQPTDNKSRRSTGFTRPTFLFMALPAALALSACGGGDGSGANTPQPGVPVASNGCDYAGLNQRLSARLRGSDADGRPLTYRIVDDPTRGSVTLTDPLRGDFTYTPNTDARGTDSFTFLVNNGRSDSAPATHRIVYIPRIMPLGDSITEGVTTPNPPASQRVSYRKKLYDDLTAASFRVDFVGSRSNGSAAGLADSDHEGNPGWCDDNSPTCSVSGGQTVDGNIARILDESLPDVILLHIGTNHFSPNASGVNSILDKISAWGQGHHRVSVFLARIIPTVDGSLDVNTYNDNVQAVAGSRAGAEILTVDQQAELRIAGDPNRADPALMGDNLHPNQTGYDRMAARWRDRILASGVLPRCP